MAWFAPWTEDPAVVVFWLPRRGAPIPEPSLFEPGRALAVAEEFYPLLRAYDADGRILATSRLRSPGWEQRGG